MRECIQALFVEFFELHCISQSQIWHVDEKTTGFPPQQLPSMFLCLDGWMVFATLCPEPSSLITC